MFIARYYFVDCPQDCRLLLDRRLPAIAWAQAASGGSPDPTKKQNLRALCVSVVNLFLKLYDTMFKIMAAIVF